MFITTFRFRPDLDIALVVTALAAIALVVTLFYAVNLVVQVS